MKDQDYNGTASVSLAVAAVAAVAAARKTGTVMSRQDRERQAFRAEQAVAARYGRDCHKSSSRKADLNRSRDTQSRTIRPNKRTRGRKWTPELEALPNKDRRQVGLGIMRFMRSIVKMLRREEQSESRTAYLAREARRQADQSKRTKRQANKKRSKFMDGLRKTGEMRRIRTAMAERFPGCVLWLRAGQPIPKGTPWYVPVSWLGTSYAGTAPESSAVPADGDKEQRAWAVKTFIKEHRAGLRIRRAERRREKHQASQELDTSQPTLQPSAIRRIELEELELYGDERQREQIANVQFGHDALLRPTHITMLAGRCGWQPSVRKGETTLGGCGVATVPPKPAATVEIGGCVLPTLGGVVLL